MTKWLANNAENLFGFTGAGILLWLAYLVWRHIPRLP